MTFFVPSEWNSASSCDRFDVREGKGGKGKEGGETYLLERDEFSVD